MLDYEHGNLLFGFLPGFFIFFKKVNHKSLLAVPSERKALCAPRSVDLREVGIQGAVTQDII